MDTCILNGNYIMKIEDMNLQQAFDYIMEKLVKQKVQCVDAQLGCAYGNDKGQHCAIGWLLDPNNPDLMEKEGDVCDLISEFRAYGDLIPSVILDNPDVFANIQSFHDCESYQRRAKAMTRLSLDGLDVSNPNVLAWINLGVDEIAIDTY